MTLKAGDVDRYTASNLTFEFSETLLEQLQAEFEAIHRAFEGTDRLPARRTAPPRPKDGMIAYAPGAPGWEPAGGPGFYGYHAGAWIKLG